MVLKRFTDFLLQGRWQAMSVAFLLAFLPLIGSISIIIAAFVTLRKGALEGALVLIAGSAAYFLKFAAINQQDPFLFGILEMLLLCNVMTWTFAVLLRQYYSWNVILEIGAWIGIACVIAIHILNPNIASWWDAHLTVYFKKSLEKSLEVTNAASDQVALTDMQKQVVAWTKNYATGIVVSVLLVNALLQLLLARWWQGIIFNPGGLRKELYQIRLSYISGLLFMLVLVLKFFNIQVAMDVEPILVTIFCVGGLSLIHYLLSVMAAHWIWLTGIYVLFIWFFPISAIIISFVGLLDTWADFRKKKQVR